MPANNLYSLLLQASRNSTGKEELVIYGSDDQLHIKCSYKTLLKDSEIRSAKVQNGQHIVLQKNRVVVLYLDEYQHSIPWFWAIIAAGGIPCLLPPLTGDEKQRNVQLSALQKLLGNPWFLTSSNLLSDIGCVEGLQTTSVEDIDYTYISEEWSITRYDASEKEDDPTILMLTSGSTGSPKVVSLNHRQVIAALEGKTTIHNTTRDDVFLNFIGLHHVANLMEIHLHALYLGARQFHVGKPIFLNNPWAFLEKVHRHRVSYTFCPNFFLSSLVNAFQSLGRGKRLVIEKTCVDKSQQVPDSRREVGIYSVDYVARLLHPSNSDLIDLSCLRALVSGGESNVTTTCNALKSFLCQYNAPRNLIKPGFGMTETCAGAIYNVEDCPEYDTERNSEFVSVGVCMPGMKMRVMGPHGTEAKDKETGLLQVSGPVVFKEYLNSPEETTKSFTNDGWFRTGDLASLDDHGRLYICGRETDTIVSNGLKHSPQSIEAAIEEAVSAVTPKFTAVFPHRPQGSETEALCVVYLPAYDISQIAKRIDATIAISKSVVKFCGICPYSIIPLPEPLLPKSTLGKLSRSNIRAAFKNGDFDAYVLPKEYACDSYIPPITSTEAAIIEVFSEQFTGIVDSRVNTNIFLLGVSSIDLLKLRIQLQKRLSFQFPITMFFANPILKNFAAELDSLQKLDSYSPVVTLQSKGDKAPIFFIHPGVGEVLIFMNLSRYIIDRPVYALRARGFDGEPYFASMKEIITTYYDAIKKVQPSGPYFLCGYSFGSILSFEIAKIMEAAGDEVKFLGVIDQPPHFKLRARGYDWHECVLTIAFFLGLIKEKYAYEILPSARQQNPDKILSHILEIAKPARLAEVGMTRERLDNWAKLACQLKAICRDYDPEGMVRNMDVFWTEPLVGIVKAKNKKEWLEDYIGKWQDFAEGSVRFHECGGTHRTIISPPFLKGFWRKFKDALCSRELGVV